MRWKRNLWKIESGFVGEERETHRAAVEAGYPFPNSKKNYLHSSNELPTRQKQANYA